MVIHRDRSRRTYRSAKHEPSIEQIGTSRSGVTARECAFNGDIESCHHQVVLRPVEVAAEIDGIVGWWAVAGGWAIDLWLNTESREHHDVELVVRRPDQPTLHSVLAAEWTLWCLDPPGSGWRPWTARSIEPPAFQLQARSPRGEFDLFTETVDHAMWTFRRDVRIRRPVEQVITISASGIPIVRPEVQLLYMAASEEPKNQHDFEIAHRHLSHEDAAWLADALDIIKPDHRWIASLR